MKQTIFFVIFNIPFLIFSQSQNEQCKIPMTDLDLKMNVNTFFVEKIIKEDNDIYTTEYGTTINAVEAFKKYGQTRNVSKINLTEDDLKKEIYFEEDDKINIAQLYSITRYTEVDKLVCYHNIWFPTFKILATNENNFVALIAENREVVEKDFKELIGNLKKTNQLNITDTKNFETYSFDFNKYFLKFKIAKTSYRNSSEAHILIEGETEEKLEKKIDLEFIVLSKSANDKHLNWLNKNYEK